MDLQSFAQAHEFANWSHSKPTSQHRQHHQHHQHQHHQHHPQHQHQQSNRTAINRSNMSYDSFGQWRSEVVDEVCGACGDYGHRKTNRNCPLFCAQLATPIKCGGCGGYGHRKDNKRCPLFSLNKRHGIVKERKRQPYVRCPPHHTPYLQPDGSVKMTRTTKPCACGGTTGYCTSMEGLQKYNAHRATRQHQEWEQIRSASAAGAQGGGGRELKSYAEALRAGDTSCKCDYCHGGVTGVDGTAEGARLYRAHMQVCPMDRLQ